MRNPQECYYCHITHEKVEGGGCYDCPNPLCTGPGGGYHRAKLKSYSIIRYNKHTVDPAEWLIEGERMARETNDPAIIAWIEPSKLKIVEAMK